MNSKSISKWYAPIVGAGLLGGASLESGNPQHILLMVSIGAVSGVLVLLLDSSSREETTCEKAAKLTMLGKALPILGVLASIIPFFGFLISLIGFLMNRSIRRWPRRVAIVGLALSTVVSLATLYIVVWELAKLLN